MGTWLQEQKLMRFIRVCRIAFLSLRLFFSWFVFAFLLSFAFVAFAAHRSVVLRHFFDFFVGRAAHPIVFSIKLVIQF